MQPDTKTNASKKTLGITGRALAIGLAAATLTLARGAAAQELVPMQPAVADRSHATAEPDTSVHPAEYVAAGALIAGVATSFALVPQRKGGWTSGGILFDDGMRHAVALGSRSGRDRAVAVSDATFYAMVAYPAAIDPTIMAATGRGAAAWQMTVINAEAFGLTGLVSVLTQRLASRTRPFARECDKNGKYDVDCNNASVESQSFLSGHTAMAFTGAGLTCAHHGRLAPYGGGAPDTVACVAAVAAASTTGITRMMADKHYTTDVLSGAALGVVSGYVLPTLIHGREPRPAREIGAHELTRPTVSLAPRIGAHEVGLGLSGVL